MKKVLVSFIVGVVFFGVCSVQNANAQSNNDAQRLVGRWVPEQGQRVSSDFIEKTLELQKDGTGIGDGYSLKWTAEKDRLTFKLDVGMGFAYDYKLSGSTLTLTSNKGASVRYTKYDEKLSKFDEKLNGTWIMEWGEVTYNNGVWERIQNDGSSSKGTYTTNNGKISTTMTHINAGRGWDRVQSSSFTWDYSIEGKTLTQKNVYGEEYKYTKK